MSSKSPGGRPPKKSDPVVVRLSHETKEAFREACRRDGRTPSAVLRELIEGYLRRDAMRERLRDINPERSLAMICRSPKTRIAAAASAAAGALAVVAFVASPSSAEIDYRAAFAALDLDGDGLMTQEEFAPSATGNYGRVLMVVSIDVEAGEPEIAETVEEFWLPVLGPSSVGIDILVFPVGASELRAEPAAYRRIVEGADATLRRMFDQGRGVAFVGFDSDGDGGISPAEFEARHLQMASAAFSRLDANADGRIDSGEFADAPLVPPQHRERWRAQGPALPQEVFARIDADGDGAVTEDEYRAGLMQP